MSKNGRCPSEDHLNTIFTPFLNHFTPKVEPTGQRRPKAAAALWVGGRRPPTTLGVKWSKNGVKIVFKWSWLGQRPFLDHFLTIF